MKTFVMVATLLTLLSLVLSACVPPPPKTPEPVSGDFETDTEGWGDHPEEQLLHSGQGVRINCTGEIKHTGKCSLEANKLTGAEKDDGHNFYLARFANSQDSSGLITLWIYIPSPNPFCNDQAKKCSTAKITVLDQENEFHEGDYYELKQPGWMELQYDLHGTEFAEPYKEIGVHFFVVNNSKGPFYIDSVTITP